MLPGNLHTHTTFCDGKNTLREMVETALEKGFDTLGFSSHMDPIIQINFLAYKMEIRRLRAEYDGRIDIICGIELDQCWDVSTVLGAEYIIGSTHFIRLKDGRLGCVDCKPDISEQICQEYYDGDWYKMTSAYYEEVVKVWDKTHCDIIGNFDLITRFNHEEPKFDENDPRYLKPALDAMECLVHTGALFEINCGAYNKGCRHDFYPSERLLRYLCQLGGNVIISSDAHEAKLLDGGFKDAIQKAKACGFKYAWMPGHRSDGKLDMRLRQIPL